LREQWVGVESPLHVVWGGRRWKRRNGRQVWESLFRRTGGGFILIRIQLFLFEFSHRMRMDRADGDGEIVFERDGRDRVFECVTHTHREGGGGGGRGRERESKRRG